MRRTRLGTAVAAAGALAIALAACGGSSSTDTSPTSNGTTSGTAATSTTASDTGAAFGGGGAAVQAAQASDWQTFDHQVNTPGLMWSETGGYDRLTALYDGKVVPYLAKSWKVAPDNTSATFTLRDDAKCQDGTPVTPTVVANSFKRLFTAPKQGVNLVGDFGAGPWTATADNQAGTVTIKVKTPFRGLVSGTSSGEAGIVCPAGLKNPKQLQTKWFGSGPYSLVSAAHGSQVVMKKNPDWKWGPLVDGHQVTADDLPDQQTWRVIPDSTTVANAMLTGDLQASRVGGPDVKRFDGNDKFDVNAVPLNFPMTIGFEQGAGHSTADPALRKAISTVIDPTNLAKAFQTEGGDPDLVTSFVNPWQDCYDPKTKDLYPSGGPDAAQKILTDAGYTGVGSKLIDPDGKPVTIRIAVIKDLVGQSGPYLLEALKPLGADVKLTNADSATVTKLVYGGQADIGMITGQANDPELSSSVISYFAGPAVSDGGYNVFGPSPQDDPEWNDTLNKAMGSSDCAPWEQLQEYALEHSIMLPVVQAKWYLVSSKDLKVSDGYFLFEPWTTRNAG